MQQLSASSAAKQYSSTLVHQFSLQSKYFIPHLPPVTDNTAAPASAASTPAAAEPQAPKPPAAKPPPKQQQQPLPPQGPFVQSSMVSSTNSNGNVETAMLTSQTVNGKTTTTALQGDKVTTTNGPMPPLMQPLQPMPWWGPGDGYGRRRSLAGLDSAQKADNAQQRWGRRCEWDTAAAVRNDKMLTCCGAWTFPVAHTARQQ
jgi:hypothetical protein